MKIKNVKNNVENEIRSILLDDGHFLFRFKKKSTSSTWSYYDIKNNVGAGLVSAQRGITLIALIITIIISYDNIKKCWYNKVSAPLTF